MFIAAEDLTEAESSNASNFASAWRLTTVNVKIDVMQVGRRGGIKRDSMCLGMQLPSESCKHVYSSGRTCHHDTHEH